MRAGAMRYKLRLLRPVAEVNSFGEEAVSYEPAATVWAERARQTGRRSEEAGEHFPDYSAEFNIRAAHEVDANWRAEQLGGHLYTVTAVIPNIERGMKTLVCERVNE